MTGKSSRKGFKKGEYISKKNEEKKKISENKLFFWKSSGSCGLVQQARRAQIRPNSKSQPSEPQDFESLHIPRKIFRKTFIKYCGLHIPKKIFQKTFLKSIVDCWWNSNKRLLVAASAPRLAWEMSSITFCQRLQVAEIFRHFQYPHRF